MRRPGEAPADFIVLSGDDAMTLPLMAVGGHGVISVSSNEIPAEMVQMVELAEQGDLRAARKLHTWLHPLMTVNFIEANPGPAKAAMAGKETSMPPEMITMSTPSAKMSGTMLLPARETSASRRASCFLETRSFRGRRSE